MGIRIQPKDVEVPEDDPFKNDLLDRKQSIEALTRLVGSIEGPCVFAVDAPWGTGKTTFLRMWKQHLRNRGFPVIEFNAWETDFAEDPLVALTAEITASLEVYLPENSGIDIRRIRNRAGKILLGAGSRLLQSATQGMIDLETILENNDEETPAETRIKTHLAVQQYIREFKDSLGIAASAVRGTDHDRSLVVVIDELDRCRPSYAIELLETAKHLFAVDNIVFVLAISRSALAHSVKIIYGTEFDAEGYLRRFFDVDFRLRAPNREHFVQTMLSSSQVADYLGPVHSNEAAEMRELLMRSLRLPHLSARDILQAIHRFTLVFGSLPSHQRPLLAMAAFAFALRTVDVELYYRFINEEASDKEVVETLRQNLRYGRFPLVSEALIIILVHENTYRSTIASSPLIQEYKTLIAEAAASDESQNQNVSHANAVLQKVQSYGYDAPIYRRAFEDAVKCIELVSQDFEE